MDLETPYGASEILRHLGKTERVIYHDNGFRSASSGAVLRRLRPLLPSLGITRLAEISQLGFHDFPVFQSTRPNIYAHTGTGQNTGSQGKGYTRDQAKISCLMESVEACCAEPRNPLLIRGSFRFLGKQHAIMNPRLFLCGEGAKKPDLNEPLLWTEALSLRHNERVLIPSETVYFPLFAEDYATRPIFSQSSNGIAAGSTYLEAVIHALYEVIERHYCGAWMRREAKAEAFVDEGLEEFRLPQFNKKAFGEYCVQLLTLSLPETRDLPMILCLVVGDGEGFFGYGCSSNVRIAVTRAISEALQSMATIFSGAREGMIFDDNYKKRNAEEHAKVFPRHKKLTMRDYRKRVHDRTFTDLRDELHFILNWLRRTGFSHAFAANLTRRALGVPVVRVVVPGMRPVDEVVGSPFLWTSAACLKERYGI